MNHKNPKLVAKYREANPNCELHWCQYTRFGRCGDHTHHLFSMRQRPDYLSNIIQLSESAHDWCHRFPADGRVLCLLTKARKGELDPEEIKICSGSYPLGWLERVTFRLDWTQLYARQLKELLEKL